MKKKILFIATLVGMTMFTSCQRFDFDEAQEEAIRQNAENIFGTIDPNQTWSSSVTGTVTITADASLKDIARVQILTESPFMNPDTRVVAEAKVQKGQTVTLDYDAPNCYNRLFAACVDSKGHYHVKGFNVGETKVSFKNATTRAARRAAADLPDFSKVALSSENSMPSYNALRTTNKYSAWKDSHWEYDHLYAPADGSAGGSWIIDGQSIYTDAIALTEDETTKLNDIFNEFLTREDKAAHNSKKDNLQIIRESDAVTLYNNELTSDGKNPITLRPVQLASTEAYWCSIYYYYYNPSDIPSGMSEADYIKTLPKFKAVDLNTERTAFSNVTGIALDKNDLTFLRLHQYLLPYYGDASNFTPTTPVTDLGFTTNGKVYRIKNNAGNFYMTYTGDETKTLQPEYAEGNAKMDNQLWQLYTKDGLTMLYNVGAKKFLFLPSKAGTYPNFSTTELSIDNYCFATCDQNKNARSVDGQEYSYLWEKNMDRRLKKANNTRIGADSKTTMDASRQWIFTEYTTTDAKDASLENIPRTTYPEPSAIIPAGYKIGFMIRKAEVTKPNDLNGQKNGCLYGYGELNRQINNFGQFMSAIEYFSMEENDPRIAMFEANGKIYLCFEEGADAQFSDVIIEMGGYDTEVYEEDPDGVDENGTGVDVSYLYEEEEVSSTTYMLMFEDRPITADYDMNDVVFRCKRQGASNRVELSLVAVGGTDEVIIQIGDLGTFVNGQGWDLNNREAHELFGKQNETGYNRFVNTLSDKAIETPRLGVYELKEGVTIPQFLAQISIINKTDGNRVISVPKTGEYPLAIIMPFDFPYPKEKESIIDAYTEFLNWAQSSSQFKYWYNNYDEENVYPIDNIFSR